MSAGVDAIYAQLLKDHGLTETLTVVAASTMRAVARLLAITAQPDLPSAELIRVSEAITRMLDTVKPAEAVGAADVSRLSNDELAELDRLQAKLLGTAPIDVEAELDAALPHRKAFPKERYEPERVFALEDENAQLRVALSMAEDRIRVLSEPPAAEPAEPPFHAATGLESAPAPEPAAAAAKPSNVTPLRSVHSSPIAPLASNQKEPWQTGGGRWPWS